MKIVFLDAKTIGDDIDLSKFNLLGEVVTYDFSTSDEVPERVADADVIITNKVEINQESVGLATNLKLVCVTATGTNNLDKSFLEDKGIAWRNVAGYSTESVAQHTFALLFYLLEKLKYYDDYVKCERYVNDTIFTHFSETFHELNKKTWGIIGLGAIGRRVADIARLFGANIIYYSPSGGAAQEGYTQVDFDTLLSVSDIISKKKNKEIANPRQICMYLSRKYTDYSLQNIGKIMGNRDHTTVIHGHDKIGKMLETDENLKSNLDIIIKKLNPPT